MTMENPVGSHDPIEEAPAQDNPQDTADKAERYKQIISGKEKQAKEAENARLLEKAARHVLADPKKLLELPEDTGKQVVKMLYEEGNATTDDYSTLIASLSTGEKPKEIDEDELLRKFEEKQEQKQANQLVQAWISKYPEDKQKEIREEFEDIADGRKLSPSKAQKIMDMIEASYKKKELEEERNNLALAGFASSGIKQRNNSSKGPKKSTVHAAKWLGMSEREMKELGLI